MSFDGKSLRGTAAPGDNLKAIHLLNAWSHERGICIGHASVSEKSNEITALPTLMKALDLKNTIITTDAAHTQIATVELATEMEADYVLPVKGNQPTLLEEVTLLFRDAEARNFCGIDGDCYETLEKSRGRVESRQYWVIDGCKLLSATKWKGLKTVGKVRRERIQKGKTTIEECYYIGSIELCARLFAQVVRGHWSIEGKLHQVLDVTFREDRQRYRDRVGARNLATVRKLGVNVLTQDTTLKCSTSNKRLAAATNPAYRETLMKKFFQCP